MNDFLNHCETTFIQRLNNAIKELLFMLLFQNNWERLVKYEWDQNIILTLDWMGSETRWIFCERGYHHTTRKNEKNDNEWDQNMNDWNERPKPMSKITFWYFGCEILGHRWYLLKILQDWNNQKLFNKQFWI